MQLRPMRSGSTIAFFVSLVPFVLGGTNAFAQT
jgi:hypothetical protein